MQASRKVVQVLPRLAPGQQARNMSGHGTPEENTKWMKFWMYSTFVSVPLVAAFGYYTWLHGEHEHVHQPKYAYLKKRDKKFPWGSKCDLFDFSCGQEEAHH